MSGRSGNPARVSTRLCDSWRGCRASCPRGARTLERVATVRARTARAWRRSSAGLSVTSTPGAADRRRRSRRAPRADRSGVDATGASGFWESLKAAARVRRWAEVCSRTSSARSGRRTRRLFVIDGGKGCARQSAASTDLGLIQRCQVHKMRNVLEHCERQKAWVRAAIAAWSAPTVGRAREQLRTWPTQLRADHPGASASIEEGLDETLTSSLSVSSGRCIRLCLDQPDRKHAGDIRRVTRNVKRWRDGSMCCAGCDGANGTEKKFRR